MQKLIDQLNEWNYHYYVLDEPLVSDHQWDELYQKLINLEKKSGIVLPDSPTQRVGGDPISAFKSHQHHSPLWSLDKSQSKQELIDWENRVHKKYAAHTEQTGEMLAPLSYTLEYKFDGLTINLTYENGQLVQAATRGNGEQGEEILPQVRTIQSVPLRVNEQAFFEVQGECIMKLSVLEAYNQTATEPLKNARNAAAGALRNRDPKVTASRKLDVFFYGIGDATALGMTTQEEIIAFLRKNQFPTLGILNTFQNITELIEQIDEVEKTREKLDFLIDGLVIKVNDLRTREVLGYTNKFPRWAIAYKFEAQETVTTINAISWEVGRTGKLTPLAHLEGVEIGGALIQRATLNNYGDILRKKVFVGAQVFVRRSNDVIPEILGLVPNQTKTATVEKPTHCPACGCELEEIGANLFCPNSLSCKPQIAARLAHFASKGAMDIEMFSNKTAEALVETLNINSIVDLYKLDKETLLGVEGFKEKKAKRLINEVEKSKTRPLAAFVFALGIPNIGKRMSKDLAQFFGSLESLRNANEETLLRIPEVGPIMAHDIIHFFADERISGQVNDLLASGVMPSIESTVQPASENSIFFGKTVVLTGTLENFDRDTATKLIETMGGRISSSVSKKTDFVLAGEKAGSKLEKAQQLGIRVIEEVEFEEIIKHEKQNENGDI